jgi:copper(I)-binding protein
VPAGATSTAVNRHTIRLFLPAVATVALASGLVACGDDDDSSDPDAAGTGEVTVDEAWVREPAAGQTNSAAYGVITNGTDGEVTLVGASTDDVSAEAVEIHETVVDDEGVMSMQEREDGFTIESGGSLTLEPGGPHVMLLGIDPAEITGDIELTFDFDGAEPVTVTAEVRELAAADSMEEMDE